MDSPHGRCDRYVSVLKRQANPLGRSKQGSARHLAAGRPTTCYSQQPETTRNPIDWRILDSESSDPLFFFHTANKHEPVENAKQEMWPRKQKVDTISHNNSRPSGTKWPAAFDSTLTHSIKSATQSQRETGKQPEILSTDHESSHVETERPIGSGHRSFIDKFSPFFNWRQSDGICRYVHGSSTRSTANGCLTRRVCGMDGSRPLTRRNS